MTNSHYVKGSIKACKSMKLVNGFKQNHYLNKEVREWIKLFQNYFYNETQMRSVGGQGPSQSTTSGYTSSDASTTGDTSITKYTALLSFSAILLSNVYYAV